MTSSAMPAHHRIPLNDTLIGQLQGAADAVDLAGSLYAVADADRAAAAELLGRRGIWIHADVFDDVRMGVSLDLICESADNGAGLIDVHLLTDGALNAAFDVVCRPGVSRITFPHEGVEDIESVAGRIRAVGAAPWLAISPDTQLEHCRPDLRHVDGLLVMLIEPGTTQSADVAHLAKVQGAAREQLPAGVDGGVSEAILGRVLGAGTRYIVVGRRLFACSNERRR